MTTIGIFYSSVDHLPETGGDQKRYHAMRDIFYEIQKRRGRAVLLAGKSSYLDDGRFSQSWVFDGHYGLIENGEESVDLVFARGRFEPRDSLEVINSHELV